MSAVTVPDALADTLAAAGPVELRAADGRVLGDFVPRTASAANGPPPAPPAEVPPPPADGRLGVPPHLRGPDPRMRDALARIKARRATGPQFSTPVNDQDLRDARAGEMYGDPV
ncbi:MAG: hypothetical protein K2X87_16830 [Gemmataceae bacterium]|nr:hypothetical protein [Gemmataceae bacterium]